MIKNWIFSKLASEDYGYMEYFKNNIAHEIFYQHEKANSSYCIFCSHLKKSYCHNSCYLCEKGYYSSCSPLLPGTYSFVDNYFYTLGVRCTPWILKPICPDFDKLQENRYFNNFTCKNPAVTIEYYEALEGIFTGICHDIRPCHICASVNIDIYNKCFFDNEVNRNKPCNRILTEVSRTFTLTAF